MSYEISNPSVKFHLDRAIGHTLADGSFQTIAREYIGGGVGDEIRNWTADNANWSADDDGDLVLHNIPLDENINLLVFWGARQRNRNHFTFKLVDSTAPAAAEYMRDLMIAFSE